MSSEALKTMAEASRPRAKEKPSEQHSDHDLLWRLYLEMLRVRIIERRISERYSQQEMRCPVHLSIGKEAVAVGVCAHLRKEDRAMSAHRSHGHYLAKGGNVHAMIAELYGREQGCCGGRGGLEGLFGRGSGVWGAGANFSNTPPNCFGLGRFRQPVGTKPSTRRLFWGKGPRAGVLRRARRFDALIGPGIRILGRGANCRQHTPNRFGLGTLRQADGTKPDHRRLFRRRRHRGGGLYRNAQPGLRFKIAHALHL